MATIGSSGALLVVITAQSLPDQDHGSLSIEKYSESRYSVTFTSLGEYISVDIDSVHIDVKERLVSFREAMGEDQMLDRSFLIFDRGHLQLFQETQSNCQYTCNLYLELESRFRDLYYSSLYAELGLQQSPTFDEEIEKLQAQSLHRLQQTLQLGSAAQSDHLLSTDSTREEDSFESVTCFYCDLVSTPRRIGNNEQSSAETDFFMHPYVPETPDHRRIFMCQHCLENWRDYREAAARENALLLPKEVNEEVCALCSDTPEVLVLCSSCQRSFCDDCLEKVLGSTAHSALKKERNWQCMACCTRVAKRPQLSRDVWISWKKMELSNTHVRSAKREREETWEREKRSRRPSAASAPAPSTSTTAKTGAKKRRTSPASLGDTTSYVVSDKPAKARGVDELYFFAQYVEYLESRLTRERDRKVEERDTDDACFLCKDGGEVVECDWVSDGGKRCGCRKVYHSYCLNFDVSSSVKKWICPRHFCAVCGQRDALRFMCALCPLSLCGPERSCPSEFARIYKKEHFSYLPHFSPSKRYSHSDVLCSLCLNSVNAIRPRLTRPLVFLEPGPTHSFSSLSFVTERQEEEEEEVIKKETRLETCVVTDDEEGTRESGR